MKEFFKKFEDRLRATEEKLDILSEWHIAKKHDGATEIAEDCRTEITNLWIEFYKLSNLYTEREASHEEFFNSNLDYLLGELKAEDDELLEFCLQKQWKPEYLLFIYLAKAVGKFEDPDKLTSIDKKNIWIYLKGLILSDIRAKKEG